MHLSYMMNSDAFNLAIIFSTYYFNWMNFNSIEKGLHEKLYL